MPESLPRTRSQLPLLKDFSLPLPNTDEFYFSGQVWDPITRQPLTNSFTTVPAPLAEKGRSKKEMVPKPKVTKPRKKKELPQLEPRSSEVDQLASSDPDEQAEAVEQKKEVTSKVKRIVAPKAFTSTSKSKSKTRSTPSPPPRPSTSTSTHAGLERFRCPVKGDGTPPSKVMTQSSLPLKRSRSVPKSPSPSRPRRKSADSDRSATEEEEEEQEVVEEKRKRPEKKKQKKGKERAASPRSEEEVLFFLEEIDEDGNPIQAQAQIQESTSPRQVTQSPPCSTPPRSRSPSRSPLRPVSPSKRTAGSSESRQLPSFSDGNSPFRSPLPSSNRSLQQKQEQQKSSPFRPSTRSGSPRRPNQPRVHETEQVGSPSPPSSSPSNVLPTQMAQRIKSSHETKPSSPPPSSARLGSQHSQEGDSTLANKDEEVRKEFVSQREKKEKLSEEARSQIEKTLEGLGEDFLGGFDGDSIDVDDGGEGDETLVNEEEGNALTMAENERKSLSRSVSPQPRPNPSPQHSYPVEFLPTQKKAREPTPPPPAPRLTTSCKAVPLHDTPQPIASTSRHDPIPNSSSLHPRLFPHQQPSRPKPSATHRLVPFHLTGLTSLMQDLLSSALNSSGPLSQFGFADPANSASSSSGEFGGGEIGFLRREVNRLTSEVVERDRVISSLSEQVRTESTGKERLREELEELEGVLRAVEEERNREREKGGWLKEGKKGLVRELRELEARCEGLERELKKRDDAGEELAEEQGGAEAEDDRENRDSAGEADEGSTREENA
ncbi:uncharacterized protein JCM6883_003735 [Sporobolomyces salmoneus]|uniref:uncharacterized protein n=1 Tax=Sporobolomyces salmoneus TaxID=183962 RepID=UPI00317A06F0